jgi:hypothetical protein
MIPEAHIGMEPAGETGVTQLQPQWTGNGEEGITQIASPVGITLEQVVEVIVMAGVVEMKVKVVVGAELMM